MPDSVVNRIAGRMSLRKPQLDSLNLLSEITSLFKLRKGTTDLAEALEAMRQTLGKSTLEFERDFPSLCFALATGVGKTRLMGAFIAYLYLKHGNKNFFVLAPNLTIYDKLIQDFTPGTPKYVFKGISEFVSLQPLIVTGDNFDTKDWEGGGLFNDRPRINIFNISKINSEVRGGKSARIKRLSEVLGESYFDRLSTLDDLVLLMDESHRYRAQAGMRAINELNPVLGLELTATPFVETTKGPVWFRNVVLEYPLSQALNDGFVKSPVVVTRQNFNPQSMSPEALEELKLEDGVRLHEWTKVELQTYAQQTGQRLVKPFMLIIARDTTHASELLRLFQEKLFDGRYRDKVIQVDSSKTGAEEDSMVKRLLAVEDPEEPTEIVIHVNMLKEGWDVTNLYTIVPLRAANARTLIEQSIGRGLRLPYGKRTGVDSVDRLSIVAHDRFQEIVNEANNPNSLIRMRTLVLSDQDLEQKVSIPSVPNFEHKLGLAPPASETQKMEISEDSPEGDVPPVLTQQEAVPAAILEVKKITLKKIQDIARNIDRHPTTASLMKQEVQEALTIAVREEFEARAIPAQGALEFDALDFEKIVQETTNILVQNTIDIPRVQIEPVDENPVVLEPFLLDLDWLQLQPVEDALWIQYLEDDRQAEVFAVEKDKLEPRLENYVVRSLIRFNDVSYDEQADLLYDLAAQVVQHLRDYLSYEDAEKVLRFNERTIADNVHAQMMQHIYEAEVEYRAYVKQGFKPLKSSAFTASGRHPVLHFRQPPPDKSKIGQYVYGGFSRCLYDVQKFDSDPERLLAIILERDSLKWFRPPAGQMQIYHQTKTGQAEYIPDFVAETENEKWILECKGRNRLQDPDVLSKADAARKWCQIATEHEKQHGGKLWRYALIPHDQIAENMTISGLLNMAII